MPYQLWTQQSLIISLSKERLTSFSIPELSHNLIPLILREGGVLVNECPKSQAINPTIDDHSLYFLDAALDSH